MKLKFIFLLLFIVSCGSKAQNPFKDVDLDMVKKLQIAQMAISELYVDSVDQKQLAEDAIRGMLDQLDPHSSYTNAEETKRFNEPLNGNFEGIGVQFNMLKDTLLVIQTVSKGPSEKVGIRSGDRIVKVGTVTIAGVKMSRDSIMSMLRGPKGSHVKLGIKRNGVKGLLTFDVTRDKIPLNTVDAVYMLRPGVGYIRLESFGTTSGKEVHDAIAQLKAQGMKNLVLDLQSNGGGYLGAAVEIASEFLKPGQLIVYTEGRKQPRASFFVEQEGSFQQGKLVVLVDEFSASASEIVSGALQDHDRATIIGRRTFGKGLVQRPLPLPDGSMIRLTTAHYYTPSGRCIQKPYVKGNKEKYEMDILDRMKNSEFLCKDSIHLDSTKVYHTLVKHRKVYGGGGIMPDIFVPLDTLKSAHYLGSIRRENILNEIVLRYVDNHRKQLQQQYRNGDVFIGKYQVPTTLITQVLQTATAKNIKPKDEHEKQVAIEQLKKDLKVLIAYDLFDRNAYYKLMNQQSSTIKAALKVMGHP